MSLACVAAVIGLLWLVWPRPADAALLQAYAQLEQSPVPVRVVGWIQAAVVRVEVLPDGYVLSVRAEQMGDLTVSGRRGSLPATNGALEWHEGDVTYAVDTTADVKVVQPRLTSLDVARQQLTSGSWVTPVLYAVYLPAFVAFTVWAARSLLLQPVRR